MTVKNIISQIEKALGRQPENYIMQILNDGLIDIANNKGSYIVSSTTDLEYRKRWYELSSRVLSIEKVEILDTNDRYIMIPKLSDPHRILRGDTDASDGELK
tara:strand:- start:3719 stop:4024 length:306 start_codon:yes stop_codon:yes gene_type:complete